MFKFFLQKKAQKNSILRFLHSCENQTITTSADAMFTLLDGFFFYIKPSRRNEKFPSEEIIM